MFLFFFRNRTEWVGLERCFEEGREGGREGPIRLRISVFMSSAGGWPASCRYDRLGGTARWCTQILHGAARRAHKWPASTIVCQPAWLEETLRSSIGSAWDKTLQANTPSDSGPVWSIMARLELPDPRCAMQRDAPVGDWRTTSGTQLCLQA